MTASGSILGHAVLRREDPAILEGEAKYFDDLAVDDLLHVVFVRSTDRARRGPVGRHLRCRGAARRPGRLLRGRSRSRPDPGFRDVPADLQPPGVRQGPGSLRRRHRGGGRGGDPGASGRRRRAGDRGLRPAARSGRRRRGARRRRDAPLPRARLEPRDRVRLRRGPDGSRRCRARGERTVREPATRRGADGAERDRRPRPTARAGSSAAYPRKVRTASRPRSPPQPGSPRTRCASSHPRSVVDSAPRPGCTSSSRSRRRRRSPSVDR